MRKIARARLKDSEALFQSRRYDSAVYLCGYAIELALKARICRTLKWAGFPSTRKEFESLTSLKTHDLGILLKLSGLENKIQAGYAAEWLVVAEWEPESRYHAIGMTSQSDAAQMIAAAKTLLRVI
ncbi:MAG: HEPN domain-containing protein [Blastocatellia bacterium]